MPTPYPKEFRRDVIAVARQGDRTLTDVAKSFGISQTCLPRWLRVADREDNSAAGTAATSSDAEAENQALRKRNKLLGAERVGHLPAAERKP